MGHHPSPTTTNSATNSPAMRGFAHSERDVNIAASPAPKTSKEALASDSLKPKTDKRNGNICADDEEMHAALCYKKCSILTNGALSKRCSAFSCSSNSCSLFEQHVSGLPLPCSGYDVNDEGGCPHPTGTCLVDEELMWGRCYKKCSVLTNNAFPHRCGPNLCSTSSGIGCFNPSNDKVALSFNSGGGKGNNDASTPSASHWPLKSLTEAMIAK